MTAVFFFIGVVLVVALRPITRRAGGNYSYSKRRRGSHPEIVWPKTKRFSHVVDDAIPSALERGHDGVGSVASTNTLCVLPWSVNDFPRDCIMRGMGKLMCLLVIANNNGLFVCLLHGNFHFRKQRKHPKFHFSEKSCLVK